ncbi:P-loop containing nucleoside triphosphate hydrolase protein [Ceratobasidium sp. AG-I]|nr:P-loop containing nucleoside triphosphate hydrolase protein [Ceratobasidium sp. AG-I]
MSRSDIHIPFDNIRSSTASIFNVTPCKFQVQACDLQLRGEDVFLVAPTGSGKSLTFLMPFIWQRDSISILVSPLQLLGGQHASHPALDTLGIKSINLTSETSSDAVFKDIARGIYQLVIASPEYIEQDPRFHTYLWDSPEFRNRVQRIIFDEAHCIIDWGDFRPSYQRLCFLRPLIPHATIFALSATCSATMITEIKTLLGVSTFKIIRLSNDRRNIKYIVKKMEHTQISFHDLAFIIPPNFTLESAPPPSFMVFVNSKLDCERAAEFLRRRLPSELRDKVVWVHADMTRGFNEQAMSDLRDGSIFGVVCTDVAGMGIDIPDIKLIVQYRVPEKFCTLFQRFGRAARHHTQTGRAVLIAETKYFDDTKRERAERAERARITRERRKRKQEDDGTTAPLKRQCTGLAPVKVEESQPVLTDYSQPATEPATEGSQELHPSSKTTTLTSRSRKRQPVEDVMDRFINASLRQPPAIVCCRAAGNRFFANPEDLKDGDEDYCCSRCCPPPVDPSACCHVCNPVLADFLKDMEAPPPTTRTPRTTTLTQSDLEQWSDKDQVLQDALEAWREQAAEAEWGPNHFIGGFGILPDEHIDRLVRLSRRGVLANLGDLQRELRWHYHTQFGTKVLDVIQSIYPRLNPPPLAQNHEANPPNPPSPNFAPAASQSTLTQAQDVLLPTAPASKGTRTITCSACRAKGHNSRSPNCPVRRRALIAEEKTAAGPVPLGPTNSPSSTASLTSHAPSPLGQPSFLSYNYSSYYRPPYIHPPYFTPPPTPSTSTAYSRRFPHLPHSSTAISPGRITSTSSTSPSIGNPSLSAASHASPGMLAAVEIAAAMAFTGGQGSVRPASSGEDAV